MADIDSIAQKLATLGIESQTYGPISSYPLQNPVDIYRTVITKDLHTITGIDESVIFPSLQWTSSLDKGDLNLAVPRLRVKGSNPSSDAQKWAAEYPASDMINPPIANGINLTFHFSHTSLPLVVIPYVFSQGLSYGFNRAHGLKNPEEPSQGSKRMILEFSSPNIAKKFHAGHLRSTIIGGFLSNLYTANGWDVVRMNYLGDWGRQYGLLAIGWQKYGSEKLLEENATAHLFDVYVKISQDFKPEEEAYDVAKKSGQDTATLEQQGLLGASKAYFKRMEDGDEDALALWRRFRDMSIEKYKESYARLNIAFDDYAGESQVSPVIMDRVEKILKDRGITEFNNGATIIDFKKHKAPKLDVAIVRNRNGTSTYLLRDIGGAIQRFEKYGFDYMIYVIMSEQNVHAQRLFKVLELLGGEYEQLAKKVQLVDFGKVMGMSTRRGNVKFLDDILDECAESMHEVMRRNASKYEQVEEPEKTADLLGMSAVMIQDMKGKRINNYPFDIERMTSFEGDTGPYLQYAHARLCSVLRKAGHSRKEFATADLSRLTEPHAIDLIRAIAQFPDIVIQTLKTLEPTTILTYLFRLTHQMSSSYDHLRVVGATEGAAVGLARAALYEAARQVLQNGMHLLGLSPVERM